jgi:hypothetical protein
VENTASATSPDAGTDAASAAVDVLPEAARGAATTAVPASDELRQLTRDGKSTSPAWQPLPRTGVTTLRTRLLGKHEVPGPGDPNGTGRARIQISLKDRTLCFRLEVSRIQLPATAAHVHEGEAGVAGDVVVPLKAPKANGISRGCVEGVDRALLRKIARHPSEYYVNVHNARYPQGAIRGQLR